MKTLLLIATFIVSLSFVYAQPANDDPCSATPLTVSTSCNYTQYTNVGATNTAGAPAPGCASYSGQDVWFSFVVPANGIVSINSLEGSMTDGGMALYSGTCGALSLVECDDDDSENGAMAKIARYSLTPGATMFVRYWDYGGGTGTFSMCVSTMPDCGSSPPAGNSCAQATPICDFNGYCGNTSGSYTANEWSSSCGFLGLSDCGLTGEFCGSIENNSFLSFVASETTISFDIWVTSSLYNYGIQLYIFQSAGSCSGDVTGYGDCYYPDMVEPGAVTITAGGLTIGETYYIMIDGNAGDVCDYVIGANSGFDIPVSVDPVSATICEGESVDLTATGGDGSYTWDADPDLNTTSGANVTATPSGGPNTYTYTVNSATGNPLCPSSSTATATITVNSCGCSVTASNSGNVCSGVGTVDLFATTLIGATYSWTGPSGYTSNAQNPTGIVPPTTPGIYTYEVTADLGGGNTCTSTTDIEVYANPTVDAGTYSPICENASNVVLSATPAGGTFTGTGVLGNSFDPSSGTQTVTYNYTDGNGCSNSDNALITVNALPTVDAGTYIPVCEDASNVVLSATPAGGSFTGTGVSGNSFDPSSGTQTVTYNYTDGNGCSNSDNALITVNALPSVDAGTYSSVCEMAADVALSGIPVGGTFSGPGVAGNNFDPSVGTQVVTYSYTDGNGCSNSDNVLITVNAVQTVDAGTYSDVCVDGALVGLSGSPVGGSFSGTGVSGTDFDPLSGTQWVYYDYNDGFGCTGLDSALITVNDLPTIDAGSYSSICENSGLVSLSGSPAGGTFSGVGVSGNNFDPSVGSQTISYDYTDGNGCSNSTTTSITVNTLPMVDAGSYPSVCETEADVALAGTPAGGTFSGVGVSGNNFDPSVGTQTVTYSYTDGNGCSNTADVSITVTNAPSVDAGTYTDACIDAGLISLAGTPVGGTFSGTGVSGTDFDPSVGTQMIYYTYNDGSCDGIDSALMTINPLPVVDAGSNQTACIGDMIVLSGSGATSYSWTSGVVDGVSFQPSLGSTMYYVTGTDINGCVNTDSVEVAVMDYPIADISASTLSGEEDLEVTFTNNSTNATSYIWDLDIIQIPSNTTDPLTEVFSAGEYEIILIAQNGSCIDQDTVKIIVSPLSPPWIHVPNVFTPNNDGSNDTFFIETKNVDELEVMIMNRWGNVMSEYSGISGAWDGQVNGDPANEGVYFYKYRAVGNNGEELIGHGNVTLIR